MGLTQQTLGYRADQQILDSELCVHAHWPELVDKTENLTSKPCSGAGAENTVQQNHVAFFLNNTEF